MCDLEFMRKVIHFHKSLVLFIFTSIIMTNNLDMPKLISLHVFTFGGNSIVRIYLFVFYYSVVDGFTRIINIYSTFFIVVISRVCVCRFRQGFHCKNRSTGTIINCKLNKEVKHVC